MQELTPQPPAPPPDPAAGETPSVGADPAVPQLPRFCGTCGATWQPAWSRCEACAAREARQATPGAVAAPRAEPEGISRIKSALGLYFALLAISMSMIVATLAEADTPAVDIVGSAAMAVVVLAWCVAGGSRRTALARALRPGPLWGYGLALGGSVVTMAVAFGVIETMHRTFDLEKFSYSQPFLEGGYGRWVVFVLVAVQPAVFEELAFRGVVLSSLMPTLSQAEAVLVSALLFMTLHLAPAAFPHTFVMGVAAAYLRLRTGSLLPCMLMHFVHNAVVIAAEIYLGI